MNQKLVFKWIGTILALAILTLGGYYFFIFSKNKEVKKEVAEPKKEVAQKGYLTVEDPECSPFSFSLETPSVIKQKLSGWKLIYVKSDDRKRFCVYLHDPLTDKDALLYSYSLDENVYKEFIQKYFSPFIRFQLLNPQQMAFGVILPNENGLLLKQRDLLTGEEKTLMDRKFPNDLRILPDFDLYVVDNYLIISVFFAKEIKKHGQIKDYIDYENYRKIIAFKIEGANLRLVKEFDLKTMWVVTPLAVRNNKLYLSEYCFECPDYMVVYPLSEQSAYDLSKKLEFYYFTFTGKSSPDNRYFAFSPLVLKDPRKKEYDPQNLKNEVAILDFETENFIETSIISPNCHGEWPNGLTCFADPEWIDNTSFVIQERDKHGGKPIHYFLVNVNGNFKEITKNEFDELRKNKDISEFKKDYEEMMEESIRGQNKILEPIGWVKNY